MMFCRKCGWEDPEVPESKRWKPAKAEESKPEPTASERLKKAMSSPGWWVGVGFVLAGGYLFGLKGVVGGALVALALGIVFRRRR
jgi:hypothetical protein